MECVALLENLNLGGRESACVGRQRQLLAIISQDMDPLGEVPVQRRLVEEVERHELDGLERRQLLDDLTEEWHRHRRLRLPIGGYGTEAAAPIAVCGYFDLSRSEPVIDAQVGWGLQ